MVPTIGETLEVLLHPLRVPPLLDSPSLLDCLLISLFRVLAGFAVALATAIPAGLLIARTGWVHHLLSPLVELARPISPVAWLPLAIILFAFDSLGTLLYGEESWRHTLLDQMQLAIIAIIWWGAFFPILLNTIHGARQVRRLHIEVALVNGAGRLDLLRQVVIPAALPAMLVGIRLGLGRAMMVIVAAEFFPGTRAGLGHLITTSHQEAEYQYAFASIIVIALLGLAFNHLLQLLERRVGGWQEKER